MNDQRTVEEIFQAASVAYNFASDDATGLPVRALRAAVSRALEMQREQIAQAIEARIIDLPGLSGDDETQRSWARGESLRFAARIARDYGQEG